MKPFLKKQFGVAAVEFAIILPVLLLLIFGAIEFGIMMYDQAVITNASREGARAGVVYVVGNPNADGIATAQSVATSYCGNNLITFGTSPGPTVTASNVGSCATPLSASCQLSVRVSYDYTGVGPGPLLSQTLNATTNMYYE